MSLATPDALIKATRTLQGLTQSELAQRSGVSLPMIQLIEAGDANPSLGILEKLSQVLRLSLEIRPDFSAREALGIYFGVLTPDRANRPSVTNPSVTKMSRSQLYEWIRLACTERSPSERAGERWHALLLALREYYPTFFRSLGECTAGSEFAVDGRLIKLKRLALPTLVEVMNS